MSARLVAQAVLPFVAATIVACDSAGGAGESCPIGSEGCACTSGSVCDPGLECRSELCVVLPSTGSSGSGGAGGGASGAGASGSTSSGGSGGADAGGEPTGGTSAAGTGAAATGGTGGEPAGGSGGAGTGGAGGTMGGSGGTSGSGSTPLRGECTETGECEAGLTCGGGFCRGPNTKESCEGLYEGLWIQVPGFCDLSCEADADCPLGTETCADQGGSMFCCGEAHPCS